MTRLRDQTSDNPDAARGFELLRGALPTKPLPETKHKVWSALQRAGRATLGGKALQVSATALVAALLRR